MLPRVVSAGRCGDEVVKAKQGLDPRSRVSTFVDRLPERALLQGRAQLGLVLRLVGLLASYQ